MTAQWYYADAVEGRTHGPVSQEELSQRACRGELCAADLVWREGMDDWVTAESLNLATIDAPPRLQRSRHPTSPPHREPPHIEPPHIEPPHIEPLHIEPPLVDPPLIAPPSVTPPRMRVAAQPAASRKGPPPMNWKRDQAQASNASRLGQPTTRRIILIVCVVSVVIGGFLIGHKLGTRQGNDESPRFIAPTSVANRNQNMHADAPPITADPPAKPTTAQSDATSQPDSTTQQENTAQPDKAHPVGPSTGFADAAMAPKAARPSFDAPAGLAGVGTVNAESRSTDELPVRPTEPQPATSPRATKPDATVGQPDSVVATPDDQGAHVLFQMLEIHRTPTFEMPGITLAQEMRYRIVSRMEVSPRQTDGKRHVVQIVERTHLDHADDLSRAALAKSLAALQNQQYTFTLNGHNEVIETSRAKTEAAATPVTVASSKGFQLTSVIDDDGWKELAQLTFFKPDEGVTQGDSYVRQMTHDWTPLGAWSGTTTFTGGAVREDSQAIRFQHALSYTPPKPKPTPTPKTLSGSLPFRVVAADCTIDQANGVIEFDRRRARVSSASETFHVHGTITAKLAGQAITITLKERQQMTVRVTDQRPDSG